MQRTDGSRGLSAAPALAGARGDAAVTTGVRCLGRSWVFINISHLRMCTPTPACMHRCRCACEHAHTLTNKHTQRYTCTLKHTQVHMHKYTCVHTHMDIHVHTCTLTTDTRMYTRRYTHTTAICNNKCFRKRLLFRTSCLPDITRSGTYYGTGLAVTVFRKGPLETEAKESETDMKRKCR